MYVNEGWESIPEERQERELDRITKLTSDRTVKQFLQRLQENKQLVEPSGFQRKLLSFYRNYDLVRFHLRVGKFRREAAFKDYANGWLYLLVGEGGVVHLNGSSPPIHSLNTNSGEEGEVSNLILDTEGRRRDYIEFFCTFVTGDHGPFFIISKIEDFDWEMDFIPVKQRDIGLSRVVSPLDLELKRRKADFRYLDKRSWSALDTDDLKAFVKNKEDFLARAKKARDIDLADTQTKNDELKKPPEPIRQIDRPVGIASKEGDEEYFFAGTVWYGDAVFSSEFRLFANGMIEMLSDEALGTVPGSNSEFSSGAALIPQLFVTKRKKYEITAAEFKTLASGAPLIIEVQGDDGQTIEQERYLLTENLRVTGDVDLRLLHMPERVVWRDVEFLGSVDVSRARFEGGLEMENCVILGKFSARNSFALYLNASENIVHGILPKKSLSPGRETDELQDYLSLDMRGTEIQEELNWKDGRIDGMADLSAISVGKSLDLTSLKVLPRTPCLEQLPFAAANMNAYDLKSAVTGLNLHGASIVGALTLRGQTDIYGDVKLSEIKVGSNISFQGLHTLPLCSSSSPLKSEGPEEIDTAEVENWLNDAAGVRQPGSPFFFDGEAIRRATLMNDSNLTLHASEIRGIVSGDSLWTRRTEICGSLILSGMKAEADVTLEAIKIKKQLACITGDFKRIHVRPDLVWKDGVLVDCDPEIGSLMFQSATIQSMDMTGLQVAGDAEFSSVEFEDGFSTDPSRIKMKMTFRFPEAEREDIAKNLRSPENVIARFSKLTLNQCEFMGECSLIGLQLSSSLIGRDILCHKPLRLGKTRLEGDCTLPLGLKMTGLKQDRLIDLTNLEAPEVIFDLDQVKKVDLERSRVSLLRMYGTTFASDVLFDLRYADIQDWAFCDETEETRDERSVFEFLDKNVEGFGKKGAVYGFDAGIAAQAERWLRRRGNDRQADRVHRRSRLKAGSVRRTNMKNPILKFFDYVGSRVFVGGFLGYWTRGWILLMLGSFTLFPVIAMATLDRQNIQPTSMRLGEEGSELQRSSAPTPETWTLLEKTRLALSTYVPIVPLVSQPRWEFAEDRPLNIPTGHDTSLEVRSWSPGGFALIVRAYFWVAWPLFLIGIAANIQRRRDIG